MSRPLRQSAFGIAFLLAAITPAEASGIGDPDAPPHQMCGLCHGLDGVSRMSRFPRLAGQKAAYIEKQLKDFLEGRRSNDGGQMASIVTEITPDQFVEVADYFSGLAPPPPIEPDQPAGDGDVAKRIFNEGDAARGLPACASCHRPGSTVSNPDAPSYAPLLTSQHPDYIAKQLRDFREGQRTNDKTGIMPAIAKALAEAEINSLAAYLGSAPRNSQEAD